MNKKAMNKLSYGLFVVTAYQEGKHNGCITNTAIQVTSEPNRISLAINKANLTHDMIQATKEFTVSVLNEAADFELFKHFGFQSGREVDKFADFPDYMMADNGTMIITRGTNSYISGKVVEEVDLGSHTLFIAEVTDMELLNNLPSVTYAYYQENIKPKPEAVGKTPDGQVVWRCTICGYEYV